MTTGAPKIDVIALIGKVKSKPGNCETVSQSSIITAPSKMVAKNKVLWLLVWKTNFEICGTAKPTKAIGPTNAVILPAKIPVAIKIKLRCFLMLMPKLFA